MRVTAIEPGLVRVFRWFAVIRLVLATLTMSAVAGANDPEELRAPLPGLVLTLVLFFLLVIPAAERRLGRAFLPLALAIASVGPIIESVASIAKKLDAGTSVNEAFRSYWLLFFLLFVPLILIAWQYRYRAVILFALGTTSLDLALTVPLIRDRDAQLEVLGAVAVGRGLLFAFVGIFLVKLVGAQRQSRQALSRHAVAMEWLATSRERNRLARDLHDTLAHSLSAVAIQLEAVRALWDDDPDEARVMLERSLEGARSGLKESRRAIHELRAGPLEEEGLVGALQKLGESLEARSPLTVDVDITTDVSGLDPSLEQVVFRIVDEALTNAAHHSGGQRAWVHLNCIDSTLELTVTDDGSGFDAAAVPVGHVGLQGMRERAELVGGVLSVSSTPDDGTCVRFEAKVASR